MTLTGRQTAIRSLAGLFLAASVGACFKAPQEPGPPYVQRLPRCEDQARLAEQARGPEAPPSDCTFVFGGADWGPSSWLPVRFTPPMGSADGAVTIDYYSPDRTELSLVGVKGVKSFAYPFMTDVTGEGGDDIFVPVEGDDGHWRMSVWLSNFLDDYEHHTAAYVHAGEIPMGRVLEVDKNLFADTSSPFSGPWRLALYRAAPSAIVSVGDVVAKGDASHCRVTGTAAEALKSLTTIQVQNICGWLGSPRDYYDYYGLAGHVGASEPR